MGRDNGEKTWEPIHVIRKDYLLEIYQFVFDDKLTNTNGWKWVKK